MVNLSDRSDPIEENEVSTEDPSASIIEVSSSSNDENYDVTLPDRQKEMLYEGATVRTDESLLDLLKLHVDSSWTKTSLDKLLLYLEKILPHPNTMPTSLYKIFKFLKDLSGDFSVTNHYYCSECLQRKNNPDELCNSCESTKSGVFFAFSLRELIKYLFEKRGLADVLDKHRESFDESDDFIRDIRDGTEYKRIKKLLTGIYDLFAMWGTDGVEVTEASHMKLYPSQFTFCDIPHILRRCFTIFTSIYCGEKSPTMELLLQPLVDELKSIYDEGGVSWTHPRTNVQYKSQIVAPLIIADAPVRADILNMQHHGGINCCNICEQTAEQCTVIIKNKEVKKSFLLYSAIPAKIRTQSSMQRQAKRAYDLNKKAKTRRVRKTKRKQPLKHVKGIKGFSVVAPIPLIDISTCVTPEYMHSICIGSVRHFTHIWTSVKGNWYTQKDSLSSAINSMLQSIKTPDFITRSPKDITKKLKASESLLWLLHYSLPTIRSLLEEEYVQHWILLVYSMFVLLQNSISKQELKVVDEALNLFVEQIGELYRKNDYTYNNHQLIHLVLIVLRWGPLWASAAFIFEDNNGFLTRIIHSKTNQSAEIVKNLKVIYAMKALEETIQKSDVESPTLKNPIKNPLNQELQDFLRNKGFNSNQLFTKVCFNNKTYTGSLLDSKLTTCNSFIEYTNETRERMYGRIILFIETDSDKINCLITVFQVDDSQYFRHAELDIKIENLIPVIETNETIIIEIDQIVTTLTQVGNFLCKRPNTVEYRY